MTPVYLCVGVGGYMGVGVDACMTVCICVYVCVFFQRCLGQFSST